MKTLSLLLSGLSLLLVSCFAPVHTTYDSAKMLEKGEVQVKGSATAYSVPILLPIPNFNNNLGVGINYGMTKKFNFSARYEHLFVNEEATIDFLRDELASDYHFVEFGAKVSIVQDVIALEVPISYYKAYGNLNFENEFYLFHPKLYLTYHLDEHFEISAIPNAMINTEGNVLPGLIVGLGISNDLQRWAFRPEFGYNGIFNGGVGFTYRF